MGVRSPSRLRLFVGSRPRALDPLANRLAVVERGARVKAEAQEKWRAVGGWAALFHPFSVPCQVSGVCSPGNRASPVFRPRRRAFLTFDNGNWPAFLAPRMTAHSACSRKVPRAWGKMKTHNILIGNCEELLNDFIEALFHEVCDGQAAVHCTRTARVGDFIQTTA